MSIEQTCASKTNLALMTAWDRSDGLPQCVEINFPPRTVVDIPRRAVDIPNFHWVATSGGTSVPVADDGSRVCLDGEQIHIVLGKLSPHSAGQRNEATYYDWRQMYNVFRGGHERLLPSDPNRKLFDLHQKIAPGGIWEATLDVLKPLIAKYAPIAHTKTLRTELIRGTILKMTAQFDLSRAADYDLPRAAMIAGSLLAGESYIETLGREFDPQLFMGVDVIGAIFTTDPGRAFLDNMSMGQYSLNMPLPFFSNISKVSDGASNLIELHKHIASIPEEYRREMANLLLDRKNRNQLQRILSSMILARTTSSNPAIAVQEQALATFHTDGKQYPTISTDLFTTTHLGGKGLLYGHPIGDSQMWRERRWSKKTSEPPQYSIAQRYSPHCLKKTYEYFDAETIIPVHGSGEYGIALQTWHEDVRDMLVAPGDVSGDWILPIGIEDGIIKVEKPRFMSFDTAKILPEVRLNENGMPRVPNSAAELLGAALYYLGDGTANKWKNLFAGGVYRYQDPNGGANLRQELQQAQMPLMVMIQAARDNQ
jgi:hypothetical protein